MKTLLPTLALLMLSAASLAAQAKSPAASKTSSATADTPASHERAIFAALEKKDFAAFNNEVGADFVFVGADGGMVWERAKSADMLKGCTTAKWAISNMQTKQVAEDLVVLNYTAAGEQTCDGKKAPSPVNALSVWRKTGGRWVAVAHSETPAAKTK
jgi:ketosteroid isomerase-like protein